MKYFIYRSIKDEVDILFQKKKEFCLGARVKTNLKDFIYF